MKRSAIIFLHAGYWILYLLLLILFVLFLEAGGIKTVSQGHEKMFGFIRLLSAMTIIPAVAGFYSFYSFLFDKYLSTKKILALCIAGVVTILACGLLGILGLNIITKGKIVVNTDIKVVLFVLLFMSILSLVHGIIALVMKGFISWYGDIKIKKELQQKNFDTELALVKSQLNPHFLFNTINNIDVLIEKDAAKASVYLNKLSDIMRFMLYEAKPEKIPLQKEVTYIEKYIDLQKIRTANVNFIQYSIEGDYSKWTIAPMLFIPFIENAFKHSSNKKTGHGIIIKIIVTAKTLHFYCENYISENPMHTDDSGGVGNELIQRRLNLLYPGQHDLVVTNNNNIFKVQLTISANEN
ncbi:sensor histidine kinase [Ferruginibacter sp. SUN106]|uniref:sensor histidine kinase n=1 Tax=Ferruginibacter sp. SUN106 TaxID=2978348 RepID=UPI003D361335